MYETAESVAERTLRSYNGRLEELILDTGWFLTRDEHRGDEIHPLPADLPGLRALLQLYQTERMIVLTKGRQLKVSWGTMAYLLAQGLMHEHELEIVQTKREEDVENLLERARFMYDHFPTWLQAIRPRISGTREHRLKIEFADRDTKMWGIPQGADVIRSNTVTRYFSDETDFQPDAKASLRAAAPSLGDTGQAIFVSTPELGGLVGQLIKGEW